VATIFSIAAYTKEAGACIHRILYTYL